MEELQKSRQWKLSSKYCHSIPFKVVMKQSNEKINYKSENVSLMGWESMIQ